MEEFSEVSTNSSDVNLYNNSYLDDNYADDPDSGPSAGPSEVFRLVRLVLLLTFLVFGTIGNILVFIIMRRGSLKDVSTCFYMSILALADTGVLWSRSLALWIGAFTKGDVNIFLWTNCKLGYFTLFFCREYSSALLTTMCVEKFCVVYFPLKMLKISNVKAAKRICMGMALLFVLYNIQTLIYYDKFRTKFGSFCSPRFPNAYGTIFYYLNAALYSFAPFVIMILTNSAIIYKFISAKRRNSRADGGGSGSLTQAMSRSATRGTAMLVTVSLACIVLTSPTAVTFAITRDPTITVRGIVSILQYLNHSINVVLYCVVGSRFRRELFNALCCRKPVPPSSANNNITGITSLTFTENQHPK